MPMSYPLYPLAPSLFEFLPVFKRVFRNVSAKYYSPLLMAGDPFFFFQPRVVAGQLPCPTVLEFAKWFYQFFPSIDFLNGILNLRESFNSGKDASPKKAQKHSTFKADVKLRKHAKDFLYIKRA